MEKRDPLREMANITSNNEPQEATDDVSKQPAPVLGHSDDKENGFAPKMQIPETNISDVECGTNKPKATKTRRSILKIFDPLCKDSPEKFQAAPSSNKPSQPIRQQLVIEDSDESEGAHTNEVSDEEAAFVDACTDTEDSRLQTPQNKKLLEDPLIQFFTPEKVSGRIKDSDSDSVPTSKDFKSQPVLLDVETSPPSNEKETSSAISPAPDIRENEIFNEINKKLSGDCDIIPTRFKFTISESGLENLNVAESIVNSEICSLNREENVVEASEAKEESKVAVVEESFIVETDLKDKENIYEISQGSTDCIIPESEIKKSIDEPSKEIEYVESSSFTKETITDDINTFVKEETVCEANKPQIEHIEQAEISEQNLEVYSESNEHSSIEFKSENQELLHRESLQQFQNEKESVELHPEQKSLLEDKQVVIQEENSKICEETDSKTDFVSETPQIQIETKSESEVEPNRGHFISDGQAEFEHQKHIPSDGEQESVKLEKQDLSCETKSKELEDIPEGASESTGLNATYEEDKEKPLVVEFVQEEICNKTTEKLDVTFENQAQQVQEKTLQGTELDTTYEVEEKSLEVESAQEEISNKTTEKLDVTFENQSHKEVLEKTLECTDLDATCEVEEKSLVESTQSVAEEISNRTSEKLNITFENQKSPEGAVTNSGNGTCGQAKEHQLESKIENIQESYTKIPKSFIGDLEEQKKGEKDQDIASDREDSCLSEEKLNDNDIKSTDERSVKEDTKVIVNDNTENEQSQLLDNPKIEVLKLDEPTTPESDKINLPAGQKSDIKLVNIDPTLKIKMADLSEKLSEQQQENSDLKLQLNAIQQAKASLELEIRQKEEVIIKTQAEALKNEQSYKQELKQLREKLKENSKLIEKDGSKELEDQLKEAKAREAKAIAELNQRTKDDLNYQKIMEEYENTIATRFADYQKLKEEHETATRHLANIELAFSDVHQKYERTKALLEGFKSNEEALNAALQSSERTCKQHEERYESLKAHAKGQIEKSNKEILMLRDKYEMDINKLKAIIKRLEIKCSSLEVSLQQKTEECAALSALCDEVTGKKV